MGQESGYKGHIHLGTATGHEVVAIYDVARRRGDGRLAPKHPTLLTRTGFLVLAMVSLSLLPVFKYTITDMEQQERLMTRLLIPLGIADVS